LNSHSIFRLAALGAFALVTPPALQAQQTMTDSGYTTIHTVSEEITERADGGMLILSVVTGVVISDDKESPLHHLTSDCMFNTAVGPDGAVESSVGFCTQRDADGDMYGAWGHADAEGGEWRMIPGSGKFANASGGGTYYTQSQWDDGRSIIRWTGEWTM